MLETRRFIARHGITQFQFNPHFPVNTLALMRMAVAAQMTGDLAALCGRGLPSHVGGTEEDGRPGGDPRGTLAIRARC